MHKIGQVQYFFCETQDRILQYMETKTIRRSMLFKIKFKQRKSDIKCKKCGFKRERAMLGYSSPKPYTKNVDPGKVWGGGNVAFRILSYNLQILQ